MAVLHVATDTGNNFRQELTLLSDHFPPYCMPICLSALDLYERDDWHRSQGLKHSIDYWYLGFQGGLSSPKTSHLPAKDLTITSVGIPQTENA